MKVLFYLYERTFMFLFFRHLFYKENWKTLSDLCFSKYEFSVINSNTSVTCFSHFIQSIEFFIL